MAILAALISAYALSATIFRTFGNGLTINRLMIIGWNAINISLLLWLVYRQIKAGSQTWVDAMYSVFSLACTVYALWGCCSCWQSRGCFPGSEFAV